MKLRILTPKQPEPWAVRILSRAPAPESRWSGPNIIVHKRSEFEHIKRFSETVELELDAKKLTTIKDNDGNAVNYLNVRLSGYLSTFKNVDRDGDTVLPGAFTETIKSFMQNPILLSDHRNSVDNVVGHFQTMVEDKNGLNFTALLSNAADVANLRFKVVEGSLKSCSMGGIFKRADDRSSVIERVSLWEGSIVPVPANPMAVFEARALSDSDKKYLANQTKFASYYHFLEAEGLLGQTMRK